MAYEAWQYVATAALLLAAGVVQAVAPHQERRDTESGPVTRGLGVAAALVGVGVLLSI